MVAAYATVDQYRTSTGDASSSDQRVTAALEEQSAKLRALAGIDAARKLTDDQAAIARSLVVDAARKQLVPPSVDGIGDVAGLKQGSFSANGFQGSWTSANPSGSAWFDRSMLKAFKRSLGCSQRIGFVMPKVGGGR